MTNPQTLFDYLSELEKEKKIEHFALQEKPLRIIFKQANRGQQMISYIDDADGISKVKARME